MEHPLLRLPQNFAKVLQEVGDEDLPDQELSARGFPIPLYLLKHVRFAQDPPPAADPTHHQVVIS